MKILLDTHTIHQRKTGMERYWRNMISCLPPAAPKAEFVLYGNKNFTHGKNRIYVPRSDNGLFRIAWGFHDAVRRWKPDIIHVNYFAPLIKIVPVVNTVHDVCFAIHPDQYRIETLAPFSLFMRRSLVMSDALICPTAVVKKQIESVYGISEDKIRVIPEAADSVFRPLKRTRDLRSYLRKKYAVTEKYFLVVGNIEKRKKPIAIIETFFELRKKFPGMQLVFVGKNMPGTDLEFLFQRGYSQQIIFLSRVADQDLCRLYNGALSLIYYSKDEGFGLPIIESFACRTPVICADTSVFREIAPKGAVFAKNDAGLYRAMESLAVRPDVAARLAREGQIVSRRYSWSETAKATARVYDEVFLNSYSVVRAERMRGKNIRKTK